MLIPKCLANLLQNFGFRKCRRGNEETEDEGGATNSGDNNRNERTRITTKRDDKYTGKFKKEKQREDTKSEQTENNNNTNKNNYNSINNVEEEEGYVEIELENIGRRGGRRKGSTVGEGESDKFSVIKRVGNKDRVSMLKIFRNSLRNSIKVDDIKEMEQEEVEEEEEEEEEEKKGMEKEYEEEIEENIKEEGNEKGYGDEIKTKIMDGKEFRIRGKEMVDYIVDYLDNVGSKRVCPEVKPGYLRPLLPAEAPHQPEPWTDIMDDVEKKIMPGVLHWNHPHFFAYFASGNSYPTIMADMLSDALSMMGFSWASGPVCTELEIIMLDWYGKAIGLPQDFISTTPGGKGGGVIQGSASECILVAMLAARHHALEYLREQEKRSANQHHKHTNATKEEDDEEEDEREEEDEDETGEQSRLLHKLVVYCSREAHSCVEKAAKICLVKIRVLEPDEKGALRGETLKKAMDQDESRGLLPFFVSCIVGSTASCTFDNLDEIGQVCRGRCRPSPDSTPGGRGLEAPPIWMHADCAYAGSAFLCPELRPLMAGIEYADSVNTNPNKWMLTCFDCSCLWVKDKIRLTRGMVVDPIYLKHDYEDELIDFRHWQIPLSRRFRSLKLFFLFRSYGIAGLQQYIRNHIQLAKYFETLVRRDSRFEVVNEVKMGLVCFRLKGPDLWTQELLAKINASGRIHMIPGVRRKRYFIRFAVTYEHAKDEHIRYAWKVIGHYTDMVLEKMNVPPATPRPRLSSRQHSFTRGVSRDVYKARSTSLYDGVSPIPVVDDDNTDNDDLNNNVFDEAFAKSV